MPIWRMTLGLIAGTAGEVHWDGTGSVPARPSGYARVIWFSPAANDPGANALEGDEWVKTT